MLKADENFSIVPLNIPVQIKKQTSKNKPLLRVELNCMVIVCNGIGMVIIIRLDVAKIVDNNKCLSELVAL